MRMIDSSDPDRFELRSVLSGKDVGAALYFLAFAGYIYADAHYGTNPSGEVSIPFMTLAFGAALTALLWRRGSTVDREAGTVTLNWGLLFPMFHRCRVITPRQVVLERTMLWDDTAWFVHTISIRSVGGPPVFVARMSNIGRAHAIAQTLAEFLRVELIDQSEEAEFRVSNFGFDRWNADRKRSRWYYTFDEQGKPRLHERDAQAPTTGGCD